MKNDRQSLDVTDQLAPLVFAASGDAGEQMGDEVAQLASGQ